MGLLRWIKKELDATNSSKRRQSDPTISKKILNPSMIRDEAYLQALAKFNEWRTKQTLTTMDNNNTSNHSLTNLNRIDRRCTIHVHGNSLRRNEFSDLDTVNECASGSDHCRSSKDSSITEKLTRCNSGKRSKSIHKEEQLKAIQTLNEWVVKQTQPQPQTKLNPISVDNDNDKTNINIYEEIQNYQSPSIIMNSSSVPLRKLKDKDIQNQNRLVSFYENTHNDIQPASASVSGNYSNPPDEFFRRNSNPFSDIKSPLPKTTASFFDKSSEEEKVKSSANKENSSILKVTGQCRKNSKNVRISNAKHAKEVSKGCEMKKLNKSSNFVTSYQRVVNKHGDLVEYAVPLVDQSGNLSSRDVSNRYDEIIDENFCFLNENNKIVDALEPFVTSNVLVTDLDNSEGNPKNHTEHEHDGIFEELASLENWSANINAADRNISQRSYHEPVPQCGIQDIHENIITSTIKNNFKCTLEMVKGKFHKSAITIRRPIPNDSVVAREALARDYRILSQIRHSDIVLLMAACVERNKTIVSLVYEPVQCTLNYLIHNNKEKISVNNCINYGLQISKAILYLHENGFVHSNVMSHNILVCEYKNCVKLSSFELAIDINYNARNEIITKGVNHIQSSPLYNDSGSNWSRAQHVITKEKLPNVFLPYNVFYRQAFTKHCYQAPELLTTTSNFVFPTHHCDIYGISLTLWEMIAREVPYNHYSLNQLTKNFHKNRNVCSLNMPKYDFMEYFQTIFDYGLRAEPDKRIQTIESFIELLDSTQNRYLAHLKKEKLTKNIEVDFECGIISGNSSVLGTPKTLIKQQEASQKNINLEDTSISTFSTPLAPEQRGSVIYERTSTLKRTKKRNIPSGYRKIFDNVPGNKQDVNGNFLQNSNTQNSNQVNALVNLKQISKSLDSIFDKCIVDTFANTPSTTSQNKSYKFEIGEFLLPNTPIARRNKILKNAWLADVPVSANMMYKKIDKEEYNEELLQKKESPNSVVLNNKPSLSCNRLCINIKIVNRTNVTNTSSPQSPQPVKVICSAESKENSTQMTDTPKTSRNSMQRRTSNIENNNVRVNLFNESFSVSKNDKSTPTENVAEESITERFPKKDESVRNYEFENILWKREKDKCEAISPKEVRSNSSVITPKRASVKEFINKFECLNKSEPRIRTTSLLLNNETRKLNKTNGNVQMNDSDVPMSFNKTEDNDKIVDGNKLEQDDHNAIVKPGPSKPVPPNLETLKHALLAVNMKKLNRRASDVIHLRKRNQTNKITNLQTRHSLCGSDLTQSFGKIIYINNDKIEKFLTEKNILKSDEVMTIRPKDDHNSAKLSCWNCGSCVFLIGKTSEIERNLLTKSISNNQNDIALPKNARNILGTKSIEDLYIDDDFCEGLEIGANMELGNGNDRSDILDLLGDMDCFPVEILN